MFLKLVFASAVCSLGVGAQTYKASFTEYGSGDQNGSGNCNTDTTACGFYTDPGYSAAASQNLYGAGPGEGAGPACGTCYRLTIETDSSGNQLSNAGNNIVVKVTNLCPAEGNPLVRAPLNQNLPLLVSDTDWIYSWAKCAQSSLSDTNQYGANVNFDTCIDSGASAALFGGQFVLD